MQFQVSKCFLKITKIRFVSFFIFWISNIVYVHVIFILNEIVLIALLSNRNSIEYDFK